MAFFHESGDHSASPEEEEVDPVTRGGDAATLRLVVDDDRGELSDEGVKAAPPLMAEARRRAALVADNLMLPNIIY